MNSADMMLMPMFVGIVQSSFTIRHYLGRIVSEMRLL